MSQRVLFEPSIEIVGLPTVQVRPCTYASAKRCFDFLFALVLLFLLFPLFLAITLAIALTSKGPILYRSERIGVGGGPFQFLKFRSMYVDADRRLTELLEQNEKDGPIFKMKRDPRVTPVGRFLRRYSLDELPQLINVLRGDMSIVGPRPPIRREVEQYDEYALQRLTVKPGITCYWQIMGRSELTFEQWMDLDHRYLQDMSFWTDLMILCRTPSAIVRGEGAY